ncbi:MAG: hypothetical protein IH973_05570 [Myxococcales bacterium]|nr:hypothetical protein [Myxococcales bacterium]
MDSGSTEERIVMDPIQNTKFVSFLKQSLDLTDSDIPEPGEWCGSGNTLGSIGLRVGLISLDQIDQIITRQAADPRLFGEIGISLKFLSEKQVEHLLMLQRFHRCLDLGALLVIEERVTFSALLHVMADYFKKSGPD